MVARLSSTTSPSLLCLVCCGCGSPLLYQVIATSVGAVVEVAVLRHAVCGTRSMTVPADGCCVREGWPVSSDDAWGLWRQKQMRAMPVFLLSKLLTCQHCSVKVIFTSNRRVGRKKIFPHVVLTAVARLMVTFSHQLKLLSWIDRRWTRGCRKIDWQERLDNAMPLLKIYWSETHSEDVAGCWDKLGWPLAEAHDTCRWRRL